MINRDNYLVNELREVKPKLVTVNLIYQFPGHAHVVSHIVKRRGVVHNFIRQEVHNFIRQSLNSGSAQFQILLAAFWTFAMV